MTLLHETTAEWPVNEYLGVDWPRQMVWRVLESIPKGQAFAVVDEAGRETAAQVDPRTRRVYYIADLPAHTRKRYALRQVSDSLQSPLSVQVSSDRIEIVNRHFGLRLPWGDRIAGPILAVRGVDRVWFGGSSFAPETNVTSFHSRIVASGPVFAEIVQSYTLGEGGTLHLSYVIDAETPGVRISQTQSGPGEGSVVWHLGREFSPTRAYWRPCHSTPSCAVDGYQRQVCPMRYPEQPDAVSIRPLYNRNFDESNFWAGWQEDDRRDLLFLGEIRPPKIQVPPEYCPLVLSAGSASGQPYLDADIPLHEGQRTFALAILDRDRVNTARPSSVGQTNDLDTFYARLNMPGLDDYHQMTLDWPELASLKFPRLWTKPDDEILNSYESPDLRLMESMNPPGRDPSGAHLVSGDEERTRHEKETLLARLNAEVDLYLTYGPAIEFALGIRAARRLRELVTRLDLILSSEVVTNDERVDTLRKLAFLAEVLCSDDAWAPAGAGMAAADPSFQSDVVSARGIIASMLTGHPRQKQWIDAALHELA